MPDYAANLLRQFGNGLSFGTTDEAEAALRAYLLRQGAYRDLKQDIERQREQWAEENPKMAMGALMGGALVPGIVGSFVPGGQGAAAASGMRVAKAARALDAPLEALLKRYAPNVLTAATGSMPGRLAVGVGDEVLNGAMYSAGQADTPSDIAQQIRDDALANAVTSLGFRAATEGLSGTRRYLKDKKAKKSLAAKKTDGVRRYIDENGEIVNEEDVIGSLAAMRRGGLAVKRKK